MEYTEEPDYEAEIHRNWYEQIAKSIVANETKSLSWPEMRGMILKNLENKRLTISEVKVFLRHYRDGQKLKELANFYQSPLARIFRLKEQVILALKDELRICQ